MKKVICLIAIVLLVLTGYSIFVPGNITAGESEDHNEVTFKSSSKFKIKKLYIYTGSVNYYSETISDVDVDSGSYTLKLDDSNLKINEGKEQTYLDDFNAGYQERKIEFTTESFKDDNKVVPLCKITYSNPKELNLPDTRVVTVTATVENKFTVVWLIDAVIVFAIAAYYALLFSNPKTDPQSLDREIRDSEAKILAERGVKYINRF